MKDKIAIVVKTSPRRKSLLWLIESVRLSFDGLNYRFYIGDEKPLDDWKLGLYDELRNQGHHVVVWDHAVPVSIAKNRLVESLQDEAFVLRADDDFELAGEFDIRKIIRILKNNNNIDYCADVERQIGGGKGLVSGNIRIRSGLIHFRNGGKPPTVRLIRDDKWKFLKSGEDRFAYADYVRGMIVLKRHCFDKVKWDESIFFSGGHMDFHLSMKRAGLQGAFTPDSVHLHRDDLKKLSVDLVTEKKWRGAGSKNQALKSDLMAKKWGGTPKVTYGMYEGFRSKIIKIFRKLILYTLNPSSLQFFRKIHNKG
jgi:sulfur transfer complex TusBCD TusB component (DsrH family)